MATPFITRDVVSADTTANGEAGLQPGLIEVHGHSPSRNASAELAGAFGVGGQPAHAGGLSPRTAQAGTVPLLPPRGTQAGPVPLLEDISPRLAPADRVTNALTIDVEDYFHVSVFDGVVPRHHWNALESRVCANTDRLLEIFAGHDVRATFFVLGWVADRFPELVLRIAAAGHEIASHGYGHRLVYDQTRNAFRADVRRAKQLLEDASGIRVHGYRAPSFSIVPRSLWALDVLIEEGYTYDASIFPIRHDRYGIAVSARHPYAIQRDCGSILEAPASTTRFGSMNLPIGGGGYFRLLPYGWTKWGIERVNRDERRPVIFYLHPWEIDPGQPRLPAGLLSRFRHYRNLDETETRLEQLLRDFTWAPLRSVLAPGHDHDEAALESAVALPYLW